MIVVSSSGYFPSTILPVRSLKNQVTRLIWGESPSSITKFSDSYESDRRQWVKLLINYTDLVTIIIIRRISCQILWLMSERLVEATHLKNGSYYSARPTPRCCEINCHLAFCDYFFKIFLYKKLKKIGNTLLQEKRKLKRSLSLVSLTVWTQQKL